MPQRKLQQRINQGNAPADALYLAFHSPSRLDDQYYAAALLTDILGYSDSSRLPKELLRQQQLVSHVDCYLTGSVDPGLLIIEARPRKGISLDILEKAIWQELNKLKQGLITDRERQKWINKVESNLAFSETNILNKAINLAYYKMLGDPHLINTVSLKFQQVTPNDIQHAARTILTQENCSELYYKGRN